MRGGGYRRKSLIWAGLGKGAVALSLAAALVAAPVVALADETASVTDVAQTATEEQVDQHPKAEARAAEQTAPVKQDTADNNAPAAAEPKAASVAKIGNTTYASLQAAVDDAQSGDEIQLVANSKENVSVKTKVTFTADAKAKPVFSGTITFNRGSEGSVVNGLTFESDGTHDGVIVHGVDASKNNIVIENSQFSTPSKVLDNKGTDNNGGDLDWQPSSVVVRYSKGVKVSSNTFELGRISEKTADGKGVEADSNVAINTYGNANDGLVIDNNELTVTKPASGVTADSTVDLIIAMGWADQTANPDAYGINNVTVSNNTFDGSADADNPSTRFAGLSQVKNITFTGNTVKNAARGIAQSVWDNNDPKKYESEGVKIGDRNTFIEVASPFEAVTAQDPANREGIGATVLKADGTLKAYGWIVDAVDAVNKGGDEFKGATITFQKAVTTQPTYTFTKQVTVTSAANRNYEFNGTIEFKARSEGSTVRGVRFTNDGARNNVFVAANNVTVQGNTFSTPSRNVEKDVQPNGIVISHVSGSVVKENTFFYGGVSGQKEVNGKLYDTSASNVAVNLIGPSVKDVTIADNTITLTKPAEGLKSDGSVFLLVANGNDTTTDKYGISDVTVSGNTYNGAAYAYAEGTTPAAPMRRQFAAINNVSGITFEKNTISDADSGFAQSGWPSKNVGSTKVTFKGNTLTNVANKATFEFTHNEEVAARVVDDADEVYGLPYATVQDAVDDARGGDDTHKGQIVVIRQDVDGKTGVTVKKKLTITAMPYVKYQGLLTLQKGAAGSDVWGIHFVLDGTSKNPYSLRSYAKSIKIYDGDPDGDGVQPGFRGNTFEVTSDAKGQPSSIWLDGNGAGDTVISTNTFNLHDASDSVVGVALSSYGSKAPVDNVTVSNNTVKFLDKDAEHFNMFVKAWGAGDATKNDFGVKNLVVENNSIDSEQPASKSSGIGLVAADGVQVTNNTIKNVGFGVFSFNYNGQSSGNKSVTVAGNTFADVDRLTSLTMADHQITYGGLDNGLASNVIKSAKLGTKKEAPSATYLAFAGWYTDEKLDTYAEDGAENAIAKYVPVKDVVSFLGGSLRMDLPATTSASMRFGYSYDLSKLGLNSGKDAEIDATGGTGWKYSFVLNNKTINGQLYPKKLNYGFNESVGKTVTNLVLTNIPVQLYDLEVTSNFTFAYTVNGVHATARLDGNGEGDEGWKPAARSVLDVAKALEKDETLKPDVKKYAGEIIDAFNDAK